MKLSLICVLSVMALGGCAPMDSDPPAYPVPDNVHYRTAGSGTPAIVFESGLGDGMETWARLYSDLSATHRVFAYDRPGYGSHPALDRAYDGDNGGKRTGEAVARHLHDTLAQAGVAPPYVLVGHSLGGLYSLAFAHLYPDEVAGIVLVDARLPGFTAACEAARVGLCDLPGLLKMSLPSPLRAEALGMAVSDDFAAGGIYGPYPVTVIAATQPSAGTTEGFQRVWRETGRRFAAGLPDGRYVEATGSGHYVHQQQPERVEAEIRRIADR